MAATLYNGPESVGVDASKVLAFHGVGENRPKYGLTGFGRRDILRVH